MHWILSGLWLPNIQLFQLLQARPRLIRLAVRLFLLKIFSGTTTLPLSYLRNFSSVLNYFSPLKLERKGKSRLSGELKIEPLPWDSPTTLWLSLPDLRTGCVMKIGSDLNLDEKNWFFGEGIPSVLHKNYVSEQNWFKKRKI